MSDVERDRAIVSRMDSIAARHWRRLEGDDRVAALAELAAAADGRTDLLIQTAGVLLGVRPADPGDPRHGRQTYAAEMLLELAGVAEDDPRVLEWAEVGRERRNRARLRPEPRRAME